MRKIPFRKFRDFPIGLYLTAFADGGMVADNTWNNADQTMKNKLLYGYGFGLNFLSLYDTQFRKNLS